MRPIRVSDFQASTLYGLSDFSPRKTEALEGGYLAGRYGGVPFLNQLVDGTN